MTTIATDLRNTQESARRIRYEPTLPFTATNVQDAIQQVALLPKTVTRTSVTAAMSPYAPASTDVFLAVDTSAGPVTILMPTGASRAGLALAVKDDAGNASPANLLSIVMSGAEKADGLSPYLIDSPFGAVRLVPKATGGYDVDA